MSDAALRTQLSAFLSWPDAHARFDEAVKGVPAKMRGIAPAGLPYSLWQLLEHIRFTQADILEFCVSRRYRTKKWPGDYWPSAAAPGNAQAWTLAIRGVRADRTALQRLTRDLSIDLFAPIPHGSGQTYLRELLLVADHTAHHVGELIVVRRLLGIWK
jgi:DinB superfamily